MVRAFLLIISIIFFSFLPKESFKTIHVKNSRVKTAYTEKEKNLQDLYKEKNINFSTQQIFLRIFKKEKEIELWSRSGSTGKFTLIKKYNICSSSGDLGPKRRQGDGQVPEGFYYIDRFNPQSSYYLSLGVSYPNASDRILGSKNPGGDIFIHGSCVTIGCMPVTDDKIKEIYILAVEAKNNGQSKIPVHIFPCRMTEENFKKLNETEDKTLAAFWTNIKKGYDHFETSKCLPKVTVEASGKYKFE